MLAALLTSLDYSLIDALGPGPGFFPFWLSLIGAALTVALLVETARDRDAPAGSIAAEPAGGAAGRRRAARAVAAAALWSRSASG